MIRAKVNAGVCGFQTLIETSSEDQQHVAIAIETDCPNLKPLEGQSIEVDAYVECFAKLGESPIVETLRQYCKHPGCPVYSGVIKAVEVAAGLALPRNAEIQISVDDE